MDAGLGIPPPTSPELIARCSCISARGPRGHVVHSLPVGRLCHPRSYHFWNDTAARALLTSALRKRQCPVVVVDPHPEMLRDGYEGSIGPRRVRFVQKGFGEWVNAGYDRAFIEDYLSSNADSYNHPNAANEPRIPGIFQYYSRGEDELVQGLGSGATAQEIADNIAASWEELTDQIGREQQLTLYRASLDLPPLE